MALFFRKSPKPATKLPDAVCEDARAAFARFVAARAGATINALALCSVDDAVEPYIMGGAGWNAVLIYRPDPQDAVHHKCHGASVGRIDRAILAARAVGRRGRDDSSGDH